MKKIIIILLLFATNIHAGFFADDNFNLTEKNGGLVMNDKVEHGLFFGFTYKLLRIDGQSRKDSFFISMGIGILNEVKDWALPYQKYGWIGGDGFSWRDILANLVGIVLLNFIDLFGINIGF